MDGEWIQEQLDFAVDIDEEVREQIPEFCIIQYVTWGILDPGQ